MSSPHHATDHGGDGRHPLVVVGGGAGGCLLALRLAHSLAGPPPLVIDPDASPGAGLAYGPGSTDAHLLNVPAGNMSLRADTPDEFLHWARQHGPARGWPGAAGAAGGDYLPRRLYGAYVQTRFAEALAAGDIAHLRARVVALRPWGACWTVVLDNGHKLIAERIVLATGNASPRPLATQDPDGVLNGPLYRNDPWSAAAEPAPDIPVPLFGSSLTMVDWALRLNAQPGRNAPVFAVSRRGLLPLPRGESTAGAPPLFGAVCDIPGLRRLRESCTHAGDDWRAVIDGLRPMTTALWRGLEAAERRRFIRHLEPYWNIHRHRVPAQSAAAIDTMLACGRLQLKAARVTALRQTGERTVQVALTCRGGGDMRAEVGLIINCSGADEDPARAGNPLLRQLLADRLVRPGSCNRGLDADEMGRLRRGDGRVHENLYRFGVLLRGVLYESTAVPDLRTQADHLAAVMRYSSRCGV